MLAQSPEAADQGKDLSLLPALPIPPGLDRLWQAAIRGPKYVLHYLARYTHRVAISKQRLVDFTNGKVGFRWKDYAHGNKHRLMTLSAEEFLRRFVLHALPRGFVRIRFFGFLANRRRATLLSLCRHLLEVDSPRCAAAGASSAQNKGGSWTCPLCGSPMVVVERLTADQIRSESTGQNVP